MSGFVWAAKQRGDSEGHPQSAGHIVSPAARRHGTGSRGGQSLLEFALVAPLLFLLLFGLIDFGRLFFVQMTLQDAVRQAGRYAITGNHLPDPNNPGQNLSRLNSVIQTARQAAAQTGLNIGNVQVASNGVSGSAGGPGDPVTISLTTDLQLITPLIGHFFGQQGIYTFTVSVTFQNEPFPSGNST